MSDEPILEVKNLRTWFPFGGGLFAGKPSQLKAVDSVSLFLRRGETLGLVGESGCGKTTLGRSILRLVEPTSGSISFHGQEIVGMPDVLLRPIRKKMQIVFQDPYASLNPRMTAGDIVAEPLQLHKIATGQKLQQAVVQLFSQVGLGADSINRYPHEFSGGQRQRIGIARAIALKPSLIVADEPVSALDVSVQAQVLNLLKRLQTEHGIGYLFISHDLSVIRHISDRIAVMYLGRIVEEGSRQQIFDNPRHPYTEALLSALPLPDPDSESKKIRLSGELPSPTNPPTGCHFHTRCPVAKPDCKDVAQQLKNIDPASDDGTTHRVACMYRV